jgi:hypothetical protein
MRRYNLPAVRRILLTAQIQSDCGKGGSCGRASDLSISNRLPEVVIWIGPLASDHALEVRMHTVCPRYDLVHHRASTACAQKRSGSKNLGSFDTNQEVAPAYDREASQCGKDKLLKYESIAAAEEAAVRAQAEYTLAHPKQPKPRPASSFCGVSASGKRWIVRIRYDSKEHNLGTFDTKQEAALAHDREARQAVREG